MSQSSEVNIVEFYNEKLSDIDFPEKYKKLINKILIFNSIYSGYFKVETIYDLINIDHDKFLKMQGIGKLYHNILEQLQDDLNRVLYNHKNKIINIEEQIFVNSNFHCNIETPLNIIRLTPKYIKLLNKIHFVIGETNIVKDILDIDASIFSKYQAVGKSYVESLKLLQRALNRQMENRNIEIYESNEHYLPSKLILNKLYLNYFFLEKSEIKQLKKLSNHYDKNINVRSISFILDIDKAYLMRISGFGYLFINSLNDLQQKIKDELIKLPEDITEYTLLNRCLFISSEIKFIPFYKIDTILLEDVEIFLWTLDEIKMDIALSRWGFNHNHESLEEVGKRYDLTRERVRQIEKTISNSLTLNFRIQPKVLWANIREKMTDDLVILLPNLSKCFSKKKLFYSFIELCCQVENNSIIEIMLPKISPNILNTFFCITQSPVSIEMVENELISNFGYSKAAACQGIKLLEKCNKIFINDQGVYPINLPASEAIAHVLMFHPDGLPWKDVARIANNKNLSYKKLNEERIAHGFNDSDYIYLCGKGMFRNLAFIEIENYDIPQLMQNLSRHILENKLTTLHLNDYFYQTNNHLNEIQYYILRHIVREYGEDYGIYFNGKSGTDSVSLDSKVTLISQATVIIKAMNESKVALTIQEIAERLKSKSTGHARFYINKLIEEGKVVRVDQFVYTTPEKAFSNINIENVIKVIYDIINTSENIIVEADVFREYINLELNLSYSKYIYAGLAKLRLNELGCYRNGSFYSKVKIPFKNLSDLCSLYCNPELPNNKNVDNIKKYVWMTDSVANEAVYWWRWKLNNGRDTLDNKLTLS